jgi:uncharacterized protein YjiS (DUF1127 family)
MMISQDCQCNETNDGFSTFLQRIWHLVKRTGKRYKEWERMKHNLRLLSSMEDRMLKDIGLSRCDAVRLNNAESFWAFMFKPESGYKDQG